MLEPQTVLTTVDRFIDDSDNIYDLYIFLYNFLIEHQQKIIDLVKKDIDLFIKLNKLIEEMLSSINRELREIDKKVIKETYALTESNLILSYALFLSIDLVFGENSYLYNGDYYDLFDDVEEVKYLNTHKTIKLGKVFLRNKSFLENMYHSEMFRMNEDIEDTIKSYKNNLIIFVDEKDYIINLISIRSTYITNKFKKNNNNIKIALVPVTNDKNYIKEKEDGNFFYIEGISNESIYKTKILNVLKDLETKDVDIVIFPEITFTEDILMEVRGYLNKNKGKFSLLISGSIWKDCANKCYIISGDGTIICHQDKLNPFRKTRDIFQKGNNEGIIVSEKNRIINIIDIENLGRISTPICSDFLTNNYNDILLNMGVNLCFVPAYTSSLEAFNTRASNFALNNGGSTFVCNCCAPVVNKINSGESTFKVSYCFVPIKQRKGKNWLESCKLPLNECRNKNNCYFLVVFSKEYCEFHGIQV